MILPFVMVAMVVGPILAVVVTVRDRTAMAPPAGALDALDGPARVRGDAALPGAPVGWRPLWPLVRLEALRLVRHPAPYLISAPLVALSLSQLMTASTVFLARDDVDMMISLVPLAWGTLIASNLNTLRSRRWHSDELLATVSVPARSRTTAHLLATLSMVPVALLLIVVEVAISMSTGRAFGTPRPWVLVAGVLIVVGGGCVGVAVARWLPRPGFGWVAIIATLVLQLNFGYLDPRWRWLHFSMYGNETIAYPELSLDHHGAHAAYLVGGILLVAGVALARDRVDGRVVAVFGAAIVIMATSGVVQTRPPSDAEAEGLARRLVEPQHGQECSTEGPVTVCADPAYGALAPQWRTAVDGVVRRVPDVALAAVPVVVRQRPTIEGRTALLAEVASIADPTRIWPDDREISTSNRWIVPAPDGDGPRPFELSLAFRTASSLVGLPPDAWWSEPANGSASWVTLPLADVGDERTRPILSPFSQCQAFGEARTVAAVWLAGQATDDARRHLRLRAGEVAGLGLDREPITFDPIDNYGALLPGVIPEQGAVPSGADILAATALLARDDAGVAATIAEHWADILVADTSTAELLGWFGLDPDSARALAVATSPPADPEGHVEDRPATPAVSGPCPAARP